MPLVSVAGALYYAVIGPSPDGDTVKAMFLLTAVPAWALSFGFAIDVLTARSRRLAIAAAVVLVPCAAVVGRVRDLRVRLVTEVAAPTEWPYLRRGFIAVATLVAVALIGWGIDSALWEDSGFDKLDQMPRGREGR